MSEKMFAALAADHLARLNVTWGLSGKMIMSLRNRGAKGNGAIAMREICDLADGLGFTLTLCTSIAKLVPYYEGFGFKTTNWSRMSPTYEVTYFARTPRPIT